MLTIQYLRKKYSFLRDLSDEELLSFDEDMQAFAKLLIDWVVEHEPRSKNTRCGLLINRKKVR